MFDSSVSINTFPATDSASRSVSSGNGALPFAKQHTLKNPIHCSGIGLHSGAKVSMTLNPAPVGSGIVFRRTDIAGRGALVPAHWASVSDTRLNTCVSNEDGIGVRTIEHLMAALAGAGIDNALIDINGGEVPVMDGSAFPFLFLIECAGIAVQDAPRMAIRILKRVQVDDDGKRASLAPARHSSFRVQIDFPTPTIGRQDCTIRLTGNGFRRDISRARTFGFEQEVSAMRAAGLGRGGSLDNAVVIASDGSSILNEEGLRYDDEFVRHKTLDAIGDLYLAGAPILGAYHGIRPGHAMNNRLLRALFADDSAWEWTILGSKDSSALSEDVSHARVLASA